LIRRQTDGYIWDVGDSAFEAVGTWNDARVAQCDIALTASGDMQFADFPDAITAGNYYVQIRWQAGGSPDTDDLKVAQGVIYWGGDTDLGGSGDEIDLTIINDNSVPPANIYEERTSTGGESILTS
jgi:hypothetical protein